MDDLMAFAVAAVSVIAGLVGLVLLATVPWYVWGDTRVGEIKLAAEKVWQRNGFDVVGYEGYELTLFGRPGGCVWYVVKRAGTDYHGCISRWGDEYHIYSLRALNAIKGD
jgi:hypothetical protein